MFSNDRLALDNLVLKCDISRLLRQIKKILVGMCVIPNLDIMLHYVSKFVPGHVITSNCFGVNKQCGRYVESFKQRKRIHVKTFKSIVNCYDGSSFCRRVGMEVINCFRKCQ